ncbi:hypothetical protein ACK6EA_00235 [Riemerella anatipestifer]|uniref:hypothetical protein n=1 Tax=Riemerella anatipestifer TaxID=34085 RepID=UPI0039845768
MEVDKRGKGNGKRVMEIDKKIGVTFLMTSSKSHPPIFIFTTATKKVLKLYVCSF